MNRRQKIYSALALVTAVGFGTTTGLRAMAQDQAGPGRGPGGGPCTMMLDWFDEDGDGKITLEEFRSGHNERFVEMDRDGDGKVTIEEFQAAPKPGRQARMQRIFQRLDTNADGTLSREEAAARSEARFQAIDANRDGVITVEELQQAMPAGHGAGKHPDGAPAPAQPQ